MQVAAVILAGVLGLGGIPGHKSKPRRVAVIAVGDDVELTGALQADLVRDVESLEEVEAISTQQLAAEIGESVESTSRMDEAAERLCARLLDEAEKAYYADDLSRAQRALDAVLDHYRRSELVVPEQRVKLHLWETSIALARGHEDAASQAARSALVLDPDLDVDLDVFRPSVAELVGAVRSDVSGSRVSFDMEGVPKGATVQIDGNTVELPVRIPGGVHYVRVEAPGFLPLRTTVAVRTDTTAQIALPIAMPTLERDLENVAWDGNLSAAQSSILEQVAEKVGASTVLLAAVDTRREGLVRMFAWHAIFDGGYQSPAIGLDEKELLEHWVEEQLGERPQPPPIDPDQWRSRLAVGLIVGRWTRLYDRIFNEPELEFEDFQYRAASFGPRITGRLWRHAGPGEFIADANAAVVFHGKPTKVQVLTSGTPSYGGLRAGNIAEFHFGLGYQFLLSAPHDHPLGFGLMGGGYYEDYSKGNGREISGLPWPHHIAAGPEVRLVGQVPFGARASLQISGVANYSTWLQQPAAALGVEGRGIGFGYEAELVLEPLYRFDVLLAVRGSTRTIVFPRTFGPDGANRIHDGTVTDRFFWPSITLRQRF